ncbi:class I SAM-dependent methyltransferase [Thiohalophilus thiocyanatoxydans]|uniref:Methyltransferase family protein n=1 Tax=Thiohalophilus thiocyanatoxydans TaxID=381308 RepID=A0A4R8IEC2_9GAMM|nr:methyltransferase domain-containing protein [Thiohalophilus thiocyanatoxydans]TDX97939.1 methyltransferase family protein [Thiohalophilus thiocyanatoxydans]
MKPVFRTVRRLIATGLLLVAASTAPLVGGASAGENVNPEINRHYQDPDFARWQSTFERPGREVYDQRHAIIEALDLKTGMHIADVGAGTGLFTRLFAQRVGATGKVYAVDIAQNFVDNILRTAREQDLTNIEGIVNDQQSTRLPGQSVDLVFLSDTYHHFEYPEAMLDSIHRALRPGGQLVIIDFRKEPGKSSDWVMSHVRANRDQVVDEVTAAGFALLREPQMLEENYFLIFRRR